MSRFVVIAGVIAGVVTLDVARAAPPVDAKVRCQAAYEHAQQLRRDGKLSSARVELGVCQETCPATLRADCDRWLAEVATLLPTVRLRARNVRGETLRDVRVLVDGKLVADPISESPVALDPGERAFRFERGGAPPVEVRVALEPGERDHPVEVSLADASPVPVASSPSRVPSYLLGGVGVAALVVGGALGIKGHVDRRDLESSCAPACDPERVSPIRTTWWAGGITAAVGVVSLTLAVLLWPRSDDAKMRAVAQSLLLRP